MKTNIGENIAVRVRLGESGFGSGLIYKTLNEEYDYIFTAKHCLCTKTPERCENNCEECSTPEIETKDIRVDNPQDSNFEVIIKDIHFLKVRDFAVIQNEKLKTEIYIRP